MNNNLAEAPVVEYRIVPFTFTFIASLNPWTVHSAWLFVAGLYGVVNVYEIPLKFINNLNTDESDAYHCLIS